MYLEDVGLCPTLLTTLVSINQLHRKGYYWDNEKRPTTLKRRNQTTVCEVKHIFGQFVLEYNPIKQKPENKAAFPAAHGEKKQPHKFTSRTPRKALSGNAWLWHNRLGHPGPQALEHLVNSCTGVRLKGPATVDCEACALGKMTRQVRRAPREFSEREGERIALDFHDYEEGHEGYTSQMLLTCRATTMTWDYYLHDRTTSTITAALNHFLKMMERSYETKVKVVECDNEITETKPRIAASLTEQGIRIEPSAPYTQAQNGGAERSGRVVKEKGRVLRISSKMPHMLWPEIGRTAVYLQNRTPSYGHNWKTPYDLFHSAIARRIGVFKPEWRPDQSHLRAFGCKAYVLTTEAQKKEKRLLRFNPKAWIGYLVGYRSSNIYRIWVPSEGKVISTRDVIFDENTTFDGKVDTFKDELRSVDIESIKEWVQIHALPENDDLEEPEAEDALEAQWNHQEDEEVDDERSEQVEEAESEVDRQSYTTAKFEPLPTPPHTPPSALLAQTIQTRSDQWQSNDPGKDQWQSKGPDRVVPWEASFMAGLKSNVVGQDQNTGTKLDRAALERNLRKGVKIHRKDLPNPPRWHRDLENHVLGELFLEAEKTHLQSHREMNSWTEISSQDPEAKGRQILDCMWVYVYKFDKHGRLAKCKARLVVRGDQQARSQTQDTYAATLAGRSFRTLISIAARFDLELIQYDVVNAFVHAPIDRDIFMKMPHGYKRKGKILKLNKALYGLRISPLLWQKELNKTLKEIGFTQVPHEPCCYIKSGVIIFFYVDDIIIAHRKEKQSDVERLISQVSARYKIDGGKEAQWFLGMEIIRDRASRQIWLSQTSYIEKIIKLANKIKTATVPMGAEELLPRSDRASPNEVNRYQKKIGSLLFAAISTRPDIAFATSRLARFLTNPSPAHHDAADRVLNYLSETKHLALRFGGADNLIVASDASFADNTLDRKSSQAFVMKLFGGLIGWRANKQDTVTTSTTEAELLALAQAVKETLFVSRLLKELSVELSDQCIKIECDNQQTINLVTSELATLKTKLRHVDIHNHWLRQEVSKGTIIIEYTPSAAMMADGLTKALPGQKWASFIEQLGLEDRPATDREIVTLDMEQQEDQIS